MGSESEALNDCAEAGYWDVETDDYEEGIFRKRIPPKFNRSNRPKPKYVAKPIVTSTNNFVVPDNKQLMQCHCGNKYLAKKADLKRGWGLSCSKQCAARRREFNKPAATEVKI